jgi:hypothetical protein
MEKDYQQAFDRLREVLAESSELPACLIIHHLRKPKNEDRHRGRSLSNLLAGSYTIISVPRSVFVLQPASSSLTAGCGARQPKLRSGCRRSPRLVGRQRMTLSRLRKAILRHAAFKRRWFDWPRRVAWATQPCNRYLSPALRPHNGSPVLISFEKSGDASATRARELMRLRALSWSNGRLRSIKPRW